MKPILDKQNYKKIDMNKYLNIIPQDLEAKAYIERAKKIYNENVDKTPSTVVRMEWDKYKVDPKKYEPDKPYIAEKVSLHEATNAAINYFRGNVVPDQINSGLLTDFQKATNLDNLKFEIDSLVIDNLMVCYYFNFDPIGCVEIHAKNAREINGYTDCHAFITKDNAFLTKVKNDSTINFPIKTSIYNGDYEIYYNKPIERFIIEWNMYKIEPKVFKLHIPLEAEKVSLKVATNTAINYYREFISIELLEHEYIDNYYDAINLDSIEFSVDSLVTLCANKDVASSRRNKWSIHDR
jgi:hypothetical protein